MSGGQRNTLSFLWIDDLGRRSTMHVIAAPDMLAAAAADVAGIGSSLSEANTAAAASTTRVIAAAGDEASAAIAALFSSHGTAFQALGAQAAAFHAQFVQALNAGARAYASSEAANAGPLQTLEQDLPVPNVSVSAFGRTLVHLGSAHATSRALAIAVGANSDATVIGGFVFGPYGQFDTAIAIGTNDVAVAGGFHQTGILLGGGVPGSNDVAFGQRQHRRRRRQRRYCRQSRPRRRRWQHADRDGHRRQPLGRHRHACRHPVIEGGVGVWPGQTDAAQHIDE
jgi:PE family